MVLDLGRMYHRAGQSLTASLPIGALITGVLLTGVLGCGPRTPAAAPEPSAESSAEATEAPPASEAPAAGDVATASPAPTGTAADPSAGDDGLDADIAALSASTQPAGAAAPAPAPAPAPEDENAGRDIVYRVTPKGLVIEIDGIHLRPEAKQVRGAGGSYGISLGIAAESFDGRKYWIHQPSGGPLSIAGKVEAKGGKVSRFGDERVGSGEEIITSANPHRFEQRWPGRGQPKLRAGDTVTLEVGLWGIRAETGRERPVRRLFVVKMVAGNKAQAVITPPTMDWGS